MSDHELITVVFAEEIDMADPQVVDTSENQEEEVQQEIDLLPS